MDPLHPFREIWLVDFEFCQPDGERPEPICMVARELRSGRLLRLWCDELRSHRDAPFPVGSDSLFVAYYASAELGCFLALGWPTPARILDLCIEFKCATNGLYPPCGAGLLGALVYHGLDALDGAEKDRWRELAIRGGPFTDDERAGLLEYCQTDVDAMAKLLPCMLPTIDLPRALLRGRYMAAVARMERTGTPIDVETLNRLRENWRYIQGDLIEQIGADFGCYVPDGISPEVVELARETGLDARHLADAVDHLVVVERTAHDERTAALDVARRRTGLTHARLSEWERSGRDSSAWTGLDVLARSLAREFPVLSIGCGYTSDGGADDADYAVDLCELLREPARKVPTKRDPEILRRAVELIRNSEPVPSNPSRLRFSAERFADWLIRNDIPWPRLVSGALALDDETFRQAARAHPEVAPLRELRHSLGALRLFDLAVGRDGRNRCMLSAFQARTSRNQPSNSKYIFGPSVWIRGLIQPTPGRAVAYVDYEQQEFGIAAALSGDKAMMEAYVSGDPYLAFAKQAGAAPHDATKGSHGAVRDLFKQCILGVQYGMGEDLLAQKIGQSPAHARELLRLHRQTYPEFWNWSDSAVARAMLYGSLQTVFGWRIHAGPGANPRSLSNFPVQANGAEMLRLACCLTTEAGIAVCAPVHDALLVEGPADAIGETVAETQRLMREASEIVLSGFAIRTDAKIVRWPDRYMDARGVGMWETVLGILDQTENLFHSRNKIREPARSGGRTSLVPVQIHPCSLLSCPSKESNGRAES